jgi:DNA replicative helicase MCM subunit Mcm2 (Cdc46/Mcm family)
MSRQKSTDGKDVVNNEIIELDAEETELETKIHLGILQRLEDRDTYTTDALRDGDEMLQIISGKEMSLFSVKEIEEIEEEVEDMEYGDYHRAAWAAYFAESDSNTVKIEELEERGYSFLRERFNEEAEARYKWALEGYRMLVDDEDATINVDGAKATKIEDLRAETDIGELRDIKVRVDTRSEIETFKRVYRADCRNCEKEHEVVRGHEESEIQINVCDYCDSSIEQNQVDRISRQHYIVSDLIEEVGANPHDVVVRASGRRIVDELEVGEDYTITVLVQVDSDDRFILDLLDFEPLNRIGELTISESEEVKIEELADQEGTIETLTESIAPNLVGGDEYELAKKAILGTLVNGSHETDGRSQIHTALIGDPSTGKSELLRAAQEISPVSEYANAENSTGVGLTASVSREDRMDTEKWVVEAGVLPRANNTPTAGLAVIDELDKARQDDVNSLHEAMSDGTVTISKANINTTLSANTSVLAAANPSEGQQFDLYNPIHDQIPLESALLSRFDFVVPFADEADEETDRRVVNSYKEKILGKYETVDYDLLRKYIITARQIIPEWNEEALEVANSAYMELRQESSRENIQIRTRDLETIIRMSEALAKLDFSEDVEERHAREAVDMVITSMSMLVPDRYDTLNADVIDYGRSEFLDALQEFEGIVKTLYEEQDGAVDEEVVVDVLDQKDINDDIDTLRKNSDVVDNNPHGYYIKD